MTPVAPPVPQTSGQPLDAATRATMEARFGHDFGRVRVHADGHAAHSAWSAGARAYAVGSSLVFGRGEYAPGTAEGRRLIAHELSHVVQQRGGRASGSHLGAGAAEREADHAAEAALAGGRVGRLSPTPVRVARKDREYGTGNVAGQDGWTYVAYLDQGFVRLVFRVTDSTPDRRIGNIGWATNNPGSLDLTTPRVSAPDPRDPEPDPAGKKRIMVDAPPAMRVAARHGAYEKNPDDISTFSRFAVFPTLAAGEGAIYPMLEVMARNNGSPTVDGLLRVYVRGTLKKGEPDPLGDNYVREIRMVLKPRIARRQAMLEPDKPLQDRLADAASLTEALMGRQFLAIHPGSWDAQMLLDSVLKVESTRDLARIGLEYSCGGGWRNEAEARAAYAGAPGKLARIDAVVGSAAVRAQMEKLLGCAGGRRA